MKIIKVPKESTTTFDKQEDQYEQYEIIKYVEYNISLLSVYDNFPFLKKCINNEGNLSSEKMNKLLGYNLMTYHGYLSSFNINMYLTAYYNKDKKWIIE